MNRKTLLEIFYLLAKCLVFVQTQEAGEPLFLTPLIKAGQIEAAQNLSLVRDIYPGITSYSGLITVNEEHNSNLFFWYFPASTNASSAPLMLFNDGGPGLTGLHCLFNVIGPLAFDSDQNLYPRNNSWHHFQNMIFMDNPVGIGFSYTNNKTDYAQSGSDAAPNIYRFLIQFLKLFPELQKNDFYNGGISFGANYGTAVAHYIHDRNQANPEIRINLKGLVLESPFIDPANQLDFGRYLQGVGLIDEKQRDSYDNIKNVIGQLIRQKKYAEAYDTYFELISTISADTGLQATYNILTDEFPIFDRTNFITQARVRKAIHVGNLPFSWRNSEVALPIAIGSMKSVKPSLEAVIQGGYKVVIYTGNLDIVTNNVGVQNTVNDLNWEGAQEFKNSTRIIWKSLDERVAGYAKSFGNFTHVMMRNAGHNCAYDQPDWTLDLVKRFIEGLSFN